jgi:hypothetical protein
MTFLPDSNLIVAGGRPGEEGDVPGLQHRLQGQGRRWY